MKTKLVILAGLIFLMGCSAEKKALKNFKMQKYEDVLSYYKGVLQNQPNNPKANYYIAESYRRSNRVREAEPFYAKAGKDDSILFFYAKSLEANGKYDLAKQTLETLRTSAEDEKMAVIVQRIVRADRKSVV